MRWWWCGSLSIVRTDPFWGKAVCLGGGRQIDAIRIDFDDAQSLERVSYLDGLSIDDGRGVAGRVKDCLQL